jgi:hypothetical protein
MGLPGAPGGAGGMHDAPARPAARVKLAIREKQRNNAPAFRCCEGIRQAAPEQAPWAVRLQTRRHFSQQLEARTRHPTAPT